MDFQKQYQEKLTTADQAVAIVQSGDWIDYGWCTATADQLDRALAKRYRELKDVKIRGGILLHPPAVLEVPEASEHFTWHSWHLSGIERKLLSKGGIYYIPVRYSELPRYYLENLPPIHVAMFQVTPMDRHGYFNFGPNASHMQAVCQRAEKIIVEVNPNLPRCCGGAENYLSINQVDWIVEGAPSEIGQLPKSSAGTVENAVASLVVEEIPDGACLQLGIGGMPNAVGTLLAQTDLKNLGVHTEMYVDAFVDLAESGKITGACKSIDRYAQTYAFAAGTQRLYDYLDENPICKAASVDYTNDARVIAQLDRFISINNAVDVDLFGQINAESTGIRHISGSGGQLDFVLGAYLSRGGKSFICCSSTFFDKRTATLKSRIRPTLETGSIVTDTRCNLHWLVTEYGKVNLKGATTWERAERIISVAHPDFRQDLVVAAEQMGIWRRSNRR